MSNFKKHIYKLPETILLSVLCPITAVETGSSPEREHRLEGPALDTFNPDKNQFLDPNGCTAMEQRVVQVGHGSLPGEFHQHSSHVVVHKAHHFPCQLRENKPGQLHQRDRVPVLASAVADVDLRSLVGVVPHALDIVRSVSVYIQKRSGPW